MRKINEEEKVYRETKLNIAMQTPELCLNSLCGPSSRRILLHVLVSFSSLFQDKINRIKQICKLSPSCNAFACLSVTFQERCAFVPSTFANPVLKIQLPKPSWWHPLQEVYINSHKNIRDHVYVMQCDFTELHSCIMH
jgi:hypothetical protein